MKGGKRNNAGRKPLYDEPTEPLTMKVPGSKKKEIKQKFQQVLKPYQIKHSKAVH